MKLFMNQPNPEQQTREEINEADKSFEAKLTELLPGMEFEESEELAEARTAVLEALKDRDGDPEFIRSVWVEYSDVCEKAVNELDDKAPDTVAKMQIAMLVHKSLIFREAEDYERYCEDLCDAETYANAKGFDEIKNAITTEIDLVW